MIDLQPAAVLEPARPLRRGRAESRQALRLILQKHWLLYAMLIPAAIWLALFHFYPLWGLTMAFKKYNIYRGFSASPWVGLDNFRQVFANPECWRILRNTLWIALGKLFAGQAAALVFALMLNEIRVRLFKRTVQTLTTLPNFLSWVIVGGIMVELLTSTGGVNRLLGAFGLGPVGFLSDSNWFPWTMILSNTWKGFGFGAVIYLAALAGINPELYEAAAVDGAGRGAALWYVTLPGILPTIVLMACLSLAGVLEAGFDQIYILQNPMVYATGDILDTWVYRKGIVDSRYDLATAVGLIKSVLGFFLIWLSYWLADRFANYRVY